MLCSCIHDRTDLDHGVRFECFLRWYGLMVVVVMVMVMLSAIVMMVMRAIVAVVIGS